MNRTFFSFMFSACILSGCATVKNSAGNKNVQVVEEQLSSSPSPLALPINIPANTAATVNYKRNSKSILHIQFNNFAIVGVAPEPEKWGYFQFPHIGHKLDGSIQISWAMNNDAMSAYGKENYGSANSVDGGKTWAIQQKNETIGSVLLPNGDRLRITTPKLYNIKDLKLPKPLDSAVLNYWKPEHIFYRLSDLPDSCRSVYMQRLKKGETEWKTEQDSLYDTDAARNSLAGKFPVVWWGDMKLAADGSVVTGIYPGFLIRKDGSVVPHHNIFFYRSTDEGHSWHVLGRILYEPDLIADPKGDKRIGLMEPAFEILKDGTYVCVSRTTDGEGNGPMYISYSKDAGKNWSKIEALGTNGVSPQLVQLANGVIVLSSGRPGVQLRFLVNGKDKTWTRPFEMVPYENEKDEVSCGYTNLIANGKNSFLLVLSDFKYKTPEGNTRKAIKVREITVTP